VELADIDQGNIKLRGEKRGKRWEGVRLCFGDKDAGGMENKLVYKCSGLII
jgi:hypothetical protein